MKRERDEKGSMENKEDRKKRILIATDGFLPRWDGIVRFLLEIVPRLKERYDIKIAAPTFEGEYRNPLDVDVLRFRQLRLRFGDIYFSFVRAKDLEESVLWADIVFVQSLGTIGMAAINAAHKKKPIIAFTHLIEWDISTKSLKRFKRIVNALTKAIAKRYYNRCDLLIHPTEEVKEIFWKNRIHKKSEVVVLGTDTKKFRPAADKDAAKERLNLNPKHLVIGYHGRIGREKDLLTLYRAFRKLEKSNENIRLLIVGKGVKEQERMFSSDRNIILPGSKLDVVPYLQAMDIYVLPSLTETTSLGTMEAMSCELAVITTKVGYIKEYIEERENGMLFPFGNSMRLAMKIQLLIDNPELRQRLGKNARITIQNRFNWEKTAEELTEIIGRY
ncbi:glycosyltransferase family 4 protein [Candidatus Woesearchaeota archaeon]|nr:glycosyltransferase family 4 protein [Candidatus Woesearchaeota archaeon]